MEGGAEACLDAEAVGRSLGQVVAEGVRVERARQHDVTPAQLNCLATFPRRCLEALHCRVNALDMAIPPTYPLQYNPLQSTCTCTHRNATLGDYLGSSKKVVRDRHGMAILCQFVKPEKGILRKQTNKQTNTHTNKQNVSRWVLRCPTLV